MRLNVSIEINGEQIPAGVIEGDDVNSYEFRYLDEYIDSGSPAISISLPIQNDAFTPSQTKCFFDGLLPEGFTRRSVAQSIHTDSDNYIDILRALGEECIGAIRIYEDGDSDDVGNYRKLSLEQIRELASKGAVKASQINVGTRLSLAGASGKVGLAYDGNGTWYLPEGMAASTHIVKQSHVRLDSIVLNECLCMNTARRMGLNTSECFIINTAEGRDEEILLASKRYDRIYDESSFKADEPIFVKKLHQEDFAQALSVEAIRKYEEPGQHRLRDIFELLRKYSANPVEDTLELWRRIIFDYLVGNTDCHIKNFSFLYSEDLKSKRLSPVYDVLSTSIYESTNKDFAMGIGGSVNIRDITRGNFERAAEEIGLGHKIAMNILDDMSDGFEEALLQTAAEIKRQGFVEAGKIAERILKAGGRF